MPLRMKLSGARLIFAMVFMAVFLCVSGSASAIDIGNCSVLSTANGFYNLTQDIFNSTNATCMSIAADNVTLDCGGKTINGKDASDTYGIYAGAKRNVTVRNCTVTDWWYGVYFSNTSGSLIEKINSSYNKWGIYFNASNANNISGSVISNNDMNGIELGSSSSSNAIENSLVYQSGQTGVYLTSSNLNNLTNLSAYSNQLSGINITSSSNNTISSCMSYLNNQYGILITSSSEENRVENTATASNGIDGVYLDTGSSKSIFRGTNSSLNVYHGFYVYSSSNNTFYNTTSVSNQRDGLYFESSSNNNVTNCEISQNGIYGIIMQQSSNNNVTACSANSNQNQGIRVYNADENRFVDCNITTNSTNYDFYAYSSSATNNYLINTTFNSSKVSISSSAISWVKWYLGLSVLETDSGAHIWNANATIKDRFNASVYSGLTNSNGQIDGQALAEYNQTSSGKNYYTNYFVNVTRYGFFGNWTSVNLTSSRLVAVYIQGMGAPVVQVKTYTLGLAENDIFKTGRIVRVRATVSTNLGRDYLSNSTITIKDSSGSTVIENALMANVSSTTNGYIYEYNYTIPQNAEGLWSINVTSTDLFGKIGYGIKKITLSQPLLQVKLVLNSTSDSIYIPGSGELPFSALTTQEYAAPEHYYLASSYGEALKGIVFSQPRPISLFTEKGTDTYSIGIRQRYSNSVLFLVFSRGRWTGINNRMKSIENGDFLSSPEPSFGFGMGNYYPVKVMLEYNSLDINNTVTIGRGYNRIFIENLGNADGKPSIKIERG